MILLHFLDFVGEGDKVVQLDLVTHMADQGGKLHLVTVDGTEHVALSSVQLLLEALSRVPREPQPLIIIGL